MSIHSAQVCSHSALAASESSHSGSSSTNPVRASVSATAVPRAANWASESPSKTSQCALRCADQLLALLMHYVDDRAEPQQVFIPGVAADLGTALARGSIAELITDRISEVPGDVQLVLCLAGPGRGYLDVAVVLVADPRRWTVTSPKVFLKVNYRVPLYGYRRRLCRGGSADQLLVCLLDEGSEEPGLVWRAA